MTILWDISHVRMQSQRGKRSLSPLYFYLTDLGFPSVIFEIIIYGSLNFLALNYPLLDLTYHFNLLQANSQG